ncbi:MAG: hypothetical protein ABIQ32_10610 [Sphingomicrobium sp.]
MKTRVRIILPLIAALTASAPALAAVANNAQGWGPRDVGDYQCGTVTAQATLLFRGRPSITVPCTADHPGWN